MARNPKLRGPGLPHREAWRPAEYAPEDAHALKALAAGRAEAGQQKRALDFIVRGICGTYDLPYRPESERDTNFALGKMSVGQQIVHILSIDLSQLKRSDNA